MLSASSLVAQGGAHGGALSDAVGQRGTSGTSSTASAHALRVCADPNNMPFSDRAGEGFENQIAALVAHELELPLQYTWWAQRRGFIRNTLRAQVCDVVIGIPSGDEQVATTRPYYRSTYVFVSRRAGNDPITSFDDPRLKNLRVGIHVIGADYNSLPPGVALARRGLVSNVVGYSIYGNYDEPSPPSKLIEAVAKGDVDVAVVWGPLAGYYVHRSPTPLVITPVSTPFATPGIPFTYEIAMGVRRADTALLAKLNKVIERRRVSIDHILRTFGVPTVQDVPALHPALSSRTARPCVHSAEDHTCA